MKKFELLRPLPNLEVGTIFLQEIDCDGDEYICDTERLYLFEMTVAYNKTWFRELTEHDDKERHLELLVAAFWSNLTFNSAIYYGYVGLDDKRPFGNCNVESDICEIIGLIPNEVDHFGGFCYSSPQLNYARKLYQEDLIPFLKRKYADK